VPIQSSAVPGPASAVGYGVTDQLRVQLPRACMAVLDGHFTFDCWTSDGISDRFLNSTVVEGRAKLERVSVRIVRAGALAETMAPCGSKSGSRRSQRTVIVDSAERPSAARALKVWRPGASGQGTLRSDAEVPSERRSTVHSTGPGTGNTARSDSD